MIKDTNIIFRTNKDLRDAFKEHCKDKNTTISKELNDFMFHSLNTITYMYIGKGHPMYSLYVTEEEYNKFNLLWDDTSKREELDNMMYYIVQDQNNRRV